MGLHEVFDFENRFGSVHDTVKIHFVRHGAYPIALLGDILNGSTSTPEMKHKFALKKKAANTNQHAAQFGLSIMINNRRDMGARAMMQDLAGVCPFSLYPLALPITFRYRFYSALIPFQIEVEWVTVNLVDTGDPDVEQWLDGDGSTEMRADRFYQQRVEPDRCGALGLHINVSRRAGQPGHVQKVRMTGGGDGIGDYAIPLGELQKKDKAHERAGDEAAWISTQPMLAVLSKKICHMINDYFEAHFPQLNLPKPDGRHKELLEDNQQDILQRLVAMQTQKGYGEFAVFTRAELYIDGVDSVQSIVCRPVETYHGYHRLVRCATIQATFNIYHRYAAIPIPFTLRYDAVLIPLQCCRTWLCFWHRHQTCKTKPTLSSCMAQTTFGTARYDS